MNNSGLSSDFPLDHLNNERTRGAVSCIEQDAIEWTRKDTRAASDLHVAHLAGETTRDTAELNSL